ncbi:PrsW family intramembrane metalloprotease [Kineococcus rhizosphaerae]|uniref:RsiW-degrading membrane proteinase PrsW (M82 family) n=1 Tax=Kineococcus rhizosphaerae TaxID=559628 RepID=A0A2T0R105_9ACTN|nr:PrsW family intramembrane metalloprotease [Kineococcus rhizosphaerae]PRY13005.1 RsiW-degrading membrane proteinase PrsW (M82 family) [Kineococcus rhizosphaerae]
MPAPRVRASALAPLAVIVLTVCGALSLTAVAMEVGWRGLLPGLALAAVPVGPVLATVLWLDRHEAEPPHLLAFAFGWGACVASLGALVLNTGAARLLQNSVGDVTNTSVVVAPLVEEGLKGLGVLLLLLKQRKQFDGVVDGVVYAAFVGVGFAYLENVLYLGRALGDDQPASLVAVFVLRCLVSPFAHPLFTMAVGVGLGLAARSHRPLHRVGAPVLGLVVAVVLHALWNASAASGITTFFELFLLLQVPVFAAAVAVALVARAREARLIGRHLQVYARTGWLGEAEVAMLASSRGRRRARAAAAARGGRAAARSVRDFQKTATELAFRRDRMRRGTVQSGPEEEVALLEQLAAQRREVLTLLP